MIVNVRQSPDFVLYMATPCHTIESVPSSDKVKGHISQGQNEDSIHRQMGSQHCQVAS